MTTTETLEKKRKPGAAPTDPNIASRSLSELPALLTLAEASLWGRCSTRTLRDALARGLLKRRGSTRHLLIGRDDLAAWLGLEEA